VSPSIAYLIKANDVAISAVEIEHQVRENRKLVDLSANEWMQRGLAETQFNISSALLFLNNFSECLQFLVPAN